MTFHLCCSSNSITDDTIRLRLFQRTLTGPTTKWYIDQPSISHGSFSSLATTFLTFFQRPIRQDAGLELLTYFKQTPTIHIPDHIHEWWKQRSLCKTHLEDKLLLDLFLRPLMSEISKYVVNSSPQNEEKAIGKDQQLELIYTQSGYLYHVLLDALHLQNFKQETPGASNVVDGLIETIAQNQPDNTLQYPGYNYNVQPFSAIAPPHHTGYYHGQPMPMKDLVMHVNLYQPTQGGQYSPTQGVPYPPRNMEVIAPSQNSYFSQGQGNQYFSFPTPEWNNPPEQANAGINLVQPSLAQQQQSVEQLNTANPTNVAKKKQKSKPKGDSCQGGNNQQ